MGFCAGWIRLVSFRGPYGHCLAIQFRCDGEWNIRGDSKTDLKGSNRTLKNNFKAGLRNIESLHLIWPTRKNENQI